MNNMSKNRGILVLIGTILVIAGLAFTAIVGVGSNRSGSMSNIILGLDLAGGVSITYETEESNPSSADMSDTVYKLQKRVESYSTEASVYQEGSNRINVEIPGVSDANQILEELGKPGSLYFQTSDGEQVLDGTNIKDAQAGSQQDGMGNSEFVVMLTLDDDGAEKFAEATAANINDIIYIMYDDEVVSSPQVQSEITGGECVINGMGSYEDAEALAATIRIGSLSLELNEVRSNVVGAQLGEDAISTSLLAAIIGLAIIMLLLCVLYRLPGLAASLSLLIYTGLVLVLINAFELTLTLPGIAGIILSIGMAVDANVIIFARVREEIAEGKSVKLSLKDGFGKATSAILDGNITTLIAATVLGFMGTGSVRGFAETLALGIVVSMFTALVVTRLIINAFFAIGFKDVKLYGSQGERKTVDFIGKRRVFFAVSATVIIAGFIVMGVNGANGEGMLNYSLEFQGGTSTTVELAEDYSIEEIDAEIVPHIEEITEDGNIQVQKVTGTNEVIIKTRTLELAERQELETLLTEEFGAAEDSMETESISASVSSEMRRDAVVAVLIAAVCMLIYIWFRFKDVRFAGSAVVALLHDVLIVLTFYAAARISAGNTFIACMLTIVGYSINATIVIFDRIRENLNLSVRKTDLKELVNRSITETLTRSIYTSVTTFVMIAMLFILGVSSIREFALPLMVGVICGGYSSVCITGALWYVMRKRSYAAEIETQKKNKKK